MHDSIKDDRLAPYSRKASEPTSTSLPPSSPATTTADLAVTLVDVSLRDGIQSEKSLLPTAVKLQIIDQLRQAGVRSLQVAAFVHPQRVPQMADAEALIARLPSKHDTAYSALVLNARGLDRLLASGLQQVDLSLSCSDTHSRRNTGLACAAAQAQILEMISLAKASGLVVRSGLQCVFGCAYEGPTAQATVSALARLLSDAGSDEIALADSTGEAFPAQVKALVAAVRTVTDKPLVLHLHDTRGLGLANVVAGYEAGVRSFDTALGGVGGCPFIPGASGNVASEDVVHLFDRMAVPTGIRADALLPATRLLEGALDYRLPGKMYQLMQQGRLAGSRASAATVEV